VWGLYLVTDRELSLSRPLEEVVLQAVRGGVSLVQLREKQATIRFFVEEAQRIKRLLASHDVPLIINDRVDVALAVGAEGAHLGQDDMPYDKARALMGPQAVIGLSVETLEQVREAEDLDADYLGLSPVFPTPTKTDTRGSFGLEGVARAREISRHRLVAIGGINAANAEQVIRAGADGVAVVSAICSAPEPQRAAEELSRIVSSALSARGIGR
jgi:thiamine-phosphate pyrophosphorylase